MMWSVEIYFFRLAFFISNNRMTTGRSGQEDKWLCRPKSSILKLQKFCLSYSLKICG